jgi:hypothetical protein
MVRRWALRGVLACAVALLLSAPAGAAVARLTPAAAPPGARVAVAGSGFPAGGRVLVRLAGGTVASAVAGVDGTFTARVPVSGGLRPRTRPLQVVARGTRLALPLAIVAGRTGGAPVALVATGGARLAASPTVARPGTPILLRASGLPAGAPVTFALTGGQRTTTVATRAGHARARLSLPAAGGIGGLATVRYRRVTLAIPTYTLPDGVAVPDLPPPTRAAPLLAAAGDIACRPGALRTATVCHQGDTAALLGQLQPDAIAAVGDLQYERGMDSEFPSFQASWGPFVDRIRPAVGNHEYLTANAAPYYAYFGSHAGPPDRGYYSYDYGGWHVVVLNSNCTIVSCDTGSAQLQWLRADLSAHPAPCTLAYWHHPRFTSANSFGGTNTVAPFWTALYAAGADVVLVGHDHDYERFAPQTPGAAPDPRTGIRQFVVGTGGRSHSRFVRLKANSEVRDNTSFGVLALTLSPRSYSWRFVPEAGRSFTDSGAGICHP